MKRQLNLMTLALAAAVALPAQALAQTTQTPKTPPAVKPATTDRSRHRRHGIGERGQCVHANCRDGRMAEVELGKLGVAERDVERCEAIRTAYG